jgi:predicted nucleic acid-binding protein
MTSAPVFVDTNVFAYALDRADTTKQRRAQDVIHDHRRAVVVSTQVLFELYAVCMRKLGMDRGDARAAVQAVADFPVTPTDRALAVDALQLAATAQLSIFDAAIVCAAQRSRCQAILTEDLSPGQRFGEVVVENPFA